MLITALLVFIEQFFTHDSSLESFYLSVAISVFLFFIPVILFIGLIIKSLLSSEKENFERESKREKPKKIE